MEIAKLREKTTKDLEKLLRQEKSALAKLVFEKTMGKLKDKSQIAKNRKEISRILTVTKEKEILEKAK